MTDLRKAVFRALDNATENGYEVGEDWTEAEDLLNLYSEIEQSHASQGDVAALVAEWKKRT